ncbi:MAG TPA: RibD family protein, partial [Candidatus Binatia bacterium]|nr:RibD family protein [Candidatus Binatia bacterium]
QLRHASDAILVGIGTVLADDPLLTDRSGLPRRRPLLRVILDSSLRLPLDSRIARSASDDVLIFCSATDSKKKRELESAGVRVEQISLESQSPSPENAPAKGLDLRAVLRHLAGLEITGVLVEGGSNIYASALAAEVVDKLFLYYAPEIFGAVNTVPFLASPMERSPVQLQSVSLHQFGNDIALEGYLRDPYAL